MKCMYCEVYPYCRRSTISGGGCDIDGSDDFGCDMGMDTEDLYYGEPDSNEDDDLPF